MDQYHAPQSLDSIVLERYEQQYLTMSDNASLRVLYHRPENPKATLYFLPGWLTLPMSWERVLPRLADDNYHVEYIESREKSTAELPKGAQITKQRMIQDVGESIRLLNLDEYIAIASSLGSTTIIHAMAQQKLSPEPMHTIIEGVWDFKVPSPLLHLINSATYPLIKTFVKWGIHRKYTDAADPEQSAKYSLGLDLAMADRIKKSVQAWNGDEIWNEIPKINAHYIVIGARKDKLHPTETIHRIAYELPNATYIEFETNKEAHDKPLVDLVNRIFENR